MSEVFSNFYIFMSEVREMFYTFMSEHHLKNSTYSQILSARNKGRFISV